ncbi:MULTISPECIES: GOLPH3/VPS74 family protein [Kitasatospora]|uniref:GOLPH3/VPS74 family protein n=1 Tax=Kitasatospora TaxID=2063 RepID=UPI0031D33DFE
MTTSRDLMITAMEVESSRPVERSELSLALAGAELIDLLAVGAATLDGDQVVPGHRTAITDRLLDQAAASLVRESPYESIGDWLWRRGRGLAAAYLDAFEVEGQLTRQHWHWIPLRTGPPVLVDSLDRRLAGDRWATNEPVLAALGAAVGIPDKGIGDAPSVAGGAVEDDAVENVLAEVNGALVELEAVRQRRSIEKAAFDNIWRGG